MPCALHLALLSAGKSIAARMAMIAITTRSSIRVNALDPPLLGRGQRCSVPPSEVDRSIGSSEGRFIKKDGFVNTIYPQARFGKCAFERTPGGLRTARAQQGSHRWPEPKRSVMGQ